MDTQITTIESNHQLVSRGNATPDQLAYQTQTLMEIYRRIMQKGTDYDVIPGTKKPSLLQPGAQILRLAAGFAVEMEHITAERDLSVGWINHSFACRLRNGEGTVVGSCEGSANSFEDRYRYRWLSGREVPEGIDKTTLISKKRKGDYGEYNLYRLENDNPSNLDNTLIKIAQKRSFVGAILMATGASRIFTQDVEDSVEPSEMPDVGGERPAPKGKPGPKPKAKPEPEPQNAPPVDYEGPTVYVKEPLSVTPHSKAKVNHYMAADATGLTARNVVKAKGWTLKDTAELSEYQAQIIIAVCEGRDEADVT